MNDVGNALRMLLVLQNLKWTKVEDLADKLEVDERTIRRYKCELEKAGIYIESRTGKYGGYRLYDDYYFDVGITQEEYSGMCYINKYLSDTEHIYKASFASVVEKITANRNNKGIGNNKGIRNGKVNVCGLDNANVNSNVIGNGKGNGNGNECDTFETHISKEYTANFSRKTEREALISIREAIALCRRLEIEYCSITSGISTRIVHPYATFQNKGDVYFLAFCENKKEFRDFKICRIESLKMLEEGFEKKDINVQQMLEKSIGIYKGEEIELKMLVFEPFSQIVKERLWVPEQKITDMDDKSILFEAKIQGLPEIKTWILGMGKYARVLEPVELIEDIKNDIEKMKDFYSA